VEGSEVLSQDVRKRVAEIMVTIASRAPYARHIFFSLSYLVRQYARRPVWHDFVSVIANLPSFVVANNRVYRVYVERLKKSVRIHLLDPSLVPPPNAVPAEEYSRYVLGRLRLMGRPSYKGVKLVKLEKKELEGFSL